jgi:hypothetical protein
VRNRRKHAGIILNLSHYEYFTIERGRTLLYAYIYVNVDVDVFVAL